MILLKICFNVGGIARISLGIEGETKKRATRVPRCPSIYSNSINRSPVEMASPAVTYTSFTTPSFGA